MAQAPLGLVDAVRHELGLGSWVLHHRGWLAEEESSRLHSLLVRELPWVQQRIVVLGREVLEPRLVSWSGDRAYRYSGTTLFPRPHHPAVGELLARVVRRVGAFGLPPFNHVLLNRYRDGRDSMGYHADDEAELGPAPSVASLSLGAPRRFLLRPRRGAAGRLCLELGPGDLLVMGGACQQTHVHAVPRTVRSGERVSLTFRAVLRDPD